ncbi:MAG: RagB/SusD family nutrient uptake outer membrane protein, partial [Bacteroidales bacterium]|nr:RagB/SusD family nutrient uptake outer membrane protein [Bacteroidales bacterium]
MKTLRNICCILFLFSIVSCDKMLDKEPLTLLEKEDILTPRGMTTLLNGAYSRMASRNYYGQYLFLYEAARGTDFFMRNVTGGSSFHTEARANDNEQNDGNNRRFWQTAYNAIRNLTILIENIGDVEGSREELDRIKGEAHVLRALCYFDLMRLFAYPPIFSIPGQARYQDARYHWGVPIINSVEVGTNVYEYEILRETADSTFRFIVEELEKGFLLLDGRSSRGPGFVNASTALALLVRTYLYLNEWQNVIDYGEHWLAMYGSQYSMISWDNYPSSYYKPFNSESIWEFGYSAADNLGTDALNYWVRYPTHNDFGSANDGRITTNNVGFAKLGF